jgi:CDP-diacylglycerol pyrophosphatase
MHRPPRLTCTAITAGLVSILAATPAAADRDALWHIVHDRCVPHEQQFHSPLPCLHVNEETGIAVLKDRKGVAQLLVIPTARITGMEDPAILNPAAPHVFTEGWRSIGTVRALADSPLPLDALSLAVNSRYGRGQDQLHLHVDCLRLDIRALLHDHLASVGQDWAPFPVPLAGHPYWARRVPTLDRPGADPFQLVASGIPNASSDMGAMTIVAVGAVEAGEPFFVLLAGRADLEAGNRGSGEELQDHGCAVARAR